MTGCSCFWECLSGTPPVCLGQPAQGPNLSGTVPAGGLRLRPVPKRCCSIDRAILTTSCATVPGLLSMIWRLRRLPRNRTGSPTILRGCASQEAAWRGSDCSVMNRTTFLISWLGAPISSIPLFLSYEISSGSYWRGPDASNVLPVRLADCTPPTP